MPSDIDFSEVVALIRKEDPRYDRRAYDFVRLGLEHTVRDRKKQEPAKQGRPAHVSGAELLEGLKIFALEQYGPMAKTVLNSWGVRRCRDFGDIVFNLIEFNVFSKSENDRREDFSDIYTFDDAFVKPFQPARSPATGSSSAAESVGSS